MISAMSFTDRLVLWLHVGFAIFTIGPVTLAISSTPRYIRKRDVAILRYLTRITAIFTIGSLLVLVLGIILSQLNHDFSHPWLTASLTLFLVAIVLLALIMRDQRRAIKALTAPAGSTQPAGSADGLGGDADVVAVEPAGGRRGSAAGEPGSGAAGNPAIQADHSAGQLPAGPATLAEHIASVEHGRIAAMGGVVNLIWLAILALMVWQP
jgi:hypothetical protein